MEVSYPASVTPGLDPSYLLPCSSRMVRTIFPRRSTIAASSSLNVNILYGLPRLLVPCVLRVGNSGNFIEMDWHPLIIHLIGRRWQGGCPALLSKRPGRLSGAGGITIFVLNWIKGAHYASRKQSRK